MELLLADKNAEANTIWQNHLNNSEVVIFRRLLQEAHERRQPQLIENLIEILQKNPNTTNACKGNAFSRLINLHIAYNDVNKAKECLERAYALGIKKEELNKTTLVRVENALKAAGQKTE